MTKAVSVSVKDATWSLPLNRKKILHPISFDLGPGKFLVLSVLMVQESQLF